MNRRSRHVGCIGTGSRNRRAAPARDFLAASRGGLPWLQWPQPKTRVQMALDRERLAARWVLRLVSGREVAEAATQALCDGCDGKVLRILAGEMAPALADVHYLVPQMFSELDVQLPAPIEAALLVAEDTAQHIVAGATPPYDGARFIWHHCAGILRDQGDHTLDSFVYWADEYEEAERRGRKDECQAAIVTSAEAFLQGRIPMRRR
jgi:hypothetical protein